jgi:tRNA-dependent cyclodipeptide synthase
MSRYKVIVRNSPGWRASNAATLGVSVSSPNWQGDKFASIMAFAAANFQTIRIDVTDALYRHNFMGEGLPAEQALAQAKALGALWLAQHQDIIHASPVRPQIVRWSEWYEHLDYVETLKGFHDAYATNPTLREAVQKDIDDFYRRKTQIPSTWEQDCSRNYLLEELAVICLQARALPSVKIYPGDELACMNAVRRLLVPEAPAGIEYEQFAKIKFQMRSAASSYIGDYGPDLERGTYKDKRKTG